MSIRVPPTTFHDRPTGAFRTESVPAVAAGRNLSTTAGQDKRERSRNAQKTAGGIERNAAALLDRDPGYAR